MLKCTFCGFQLYSALSKWFYLTSGKFCLKLIYCPCFFLAAGPQFAQNYILLYNALQFPFSPLTMILLNPIELLFQNSSVFHTNCELFLANNWRSVSKIWAILQLSVFACFFRTLLIMPRQTSWCACSITAFITRIGGTLVHGLSVNLHVTF